MPHTVLRKLPPKTTRVPLNYEWLALVEMGQEFSLEFSFADHLQAFIEIPVPVGEYFFTYYLMFVCMYVCICLFVCYKKGFITFDPNNATFTQKIDDCTGRIMNFIRLKTVQVWNALGWGGPRKHGLALVSL